MPDQIEEEKKLTIKQRKWLKAYIKTGNATQAALLVYNVKGKNKRNIAGSIGSENLQKLDFIDLLEEMGVTDVSLVEVLKEGLESEYQILDKKTGLVVETFKDNKTRHKYLETALKLRKRLTDNLDITSGGKPIPILGMIDVSSNNGINENKEPQ